MHSAAAFSNASQASSRHNMTQYNTSMNNHCSGHMDNINTDQKLGLLMLVVKPCNARTHPLNSFSSEQALGMLHTAAKFTLHSSTPSGTRLHSFQLQSAESRRWSQQHFWIPVQAIFHQPAGILGPRHFPQTPDWASDSTPWGSERPSWVPEWASGLLRGAGRAEALV